MNRSSVRNCLRISLLVLGLAIGSTAFAHAGLVKAVPAANSHVSSAEKIELTFNEALVPRASKLTLSKVGADGKLTPVNHVTIELAEGNKLLRATPGHALAAGEYEVEWRVVGGDNHVITGRHRFMIH